VLLSGVALFVLQRMWSGSRHNVRKLEGIQVAHDSPEAPLLLPDVIAKSTDLSVDGTPRTVQFSDAIKARLAYNRLRYEKLSVHRQRKFVYGATYNRIFPGYLEINPMEADYDLVVTLHTGKVSLVQVRLVSPDEGLEKDKLITSVVELGRALSVRPGNSRGAKVGDSGSMHAIGLKSSSSKEVFKTSEDAVKKINPVCRVMKEWLQDNMRDVLKEIIHVDKSLLKVVYPACMPSGPSSRMVVSVNLGNSPHYDCGDTSTSVGIWVEEKPGQSTNWYFVLPNISIQGSKGVLIKLVHGVAISWDARVIYHCTSKTYQGDSNKTYGCMWGSTRAA
jgi:hypothetical protein